MPSQLRLAFSFAVRIVCVAFAVLAAFCIPESRKYLDESLVGKDDVVFMPLVICKPKSIELDGKLITFDANDGTGCHTMSFLANACAMSLIFSIVALVLFGVADCFARRGKSRIPGAVVGMGLFLIFILLQTAVTTWALGSESRFWEKYYDESLPEFKSFSAYEEVRMHGDGMLLIATGLMAVLCAFLFAVESTLSLCWPINTKARADEGSDTMVADLTETSDNVPPVNLMAREPATDKKPAGMKAKLGKFIGKDWEA